MISVALLGHADEALLAFAAFLCLVIAVTLASTNRRPCSRCQRDCAGRIAGGTPDSPLCIDCVKAERSGGDGR